MDLKLTLYLNTKLINLSNLPTAILSKEGNPLLRVKK